MTRHSQPATATFTGADANKLVADVYGETGEAVLLMHGAGQTRHAWKKTGEGIARTGRVAYAIDLRGHGDSEWVENGSYTFNDFAADARAVADTLAARAGGRRPIVIGASLGGISALLAEAAGEDEGKNIFSALVLVDVTPRVSVDGVAKVQGFMHAHAKEGFGSIAEAADAVAKYLPHRPRPRSHEGLKKNLRLSPDGRWRWHWDPRVLEGRRPIGGMRSQIEETMVAAAKKLKIPALLVRGSASELVQEAHAKEFLELVPHAEYADVSGARHMVAGDRNDSFSQAILGFIGRLPA